jgi:hypothetical protein
MTFSMLGAQGIASGVISGSRPSLLTANASLNTKGNYGTAHFTSTAFAAAWIMVTITRNTARLFLVDIAVGAAGSEQVIIANLPSSSVIVSSGSSATYLFPLFIPAGSRIASRCQDSLGNDPIDVHVILFAPMFGGERGLGAVETCGAITATSRGTTIPGHASVANSKGSWTELIASTAFAYKWVCLGIGHTNAIAAATSWTLDIGIGAGGAETVLVPDIALHAGTVADTIPNNGRSFPLSIPAGTRISARVACSVTTASEKDIELILLGAG